MKGCVVNKDDDQILITPLNDRIQRLWGHITDMTEDQLRDHIRKIRSDRRVLKAKPGVKKQIKVSSDKARDRARSLLADADTDMIARILKGMADGN
jgi:hypothetical protein